MSDIHVFAVSGFSGTGKTFLIGKLVQRLCEKGFSVGVVKRSEEDVLAPPDTDTRRHQDAGANPVILLGPSTTTIRHRHRMKLYDAIGECEIDFLLLEGFKSSNVPRFWCIGNREEMLLSAPENTKVIVKWNKSGKGEDSNQIPIVTSDEVETLLDIVEKDAILLSECEL